VLGQNQKGENAPVIEIGQKLVHLEHKELLLRHSVQITCQAIDHDDLNPVLLNGAAHSRREFPERQISRINLLDMERARLNERRYVHPDAFGAG